MRYDIHGLLLGAMVLLTAILSGCTRYYYVVPSPIIMQHEETLPMAVGLLMEPEIRDQWYRKKSMGSRLRIDVPVGKVALDFARADLQKAFENYYAERYYDRRSETGLLVIVNEIDYRLDGREVTVEMELSIEDETSTELMRKRYRGVGNDAESVTGMFVGGQRDVEVNTARAFEQIYSELVHDIRVLVGAEPSDPEPDGEEGSSEAGESAAPSVSSEPSESADSPELPEAGLDMDAEAAEPPPGE